MEKKIMNTLPHHAPVKLSRHKAHFCALSGVQKANHLSRKIEARFRRYPAIFISIFLVATLLTGCALTSSNISKPNVYITPSASIVRKIAVMPFKAATELIGASVSDMVVTEILKANKYDVVERNQLSQVLGETELALSGVSEAKAAQIGALLGADGVVVGTVAEYGMTASRGRTYPVVAFSMRMIHCETGKIIWSVDHASRAPSSSTPLPIHARTIVHEAVADLLRQWRR